MKRIKLSLVALAIVATAAAFTTRTAPGDYLKISANQYVDKDTYLQDHPLSSCSVNASEICTYERFQTTGVGTPDADFRASTTSAEGSGFQFNNIP